MQSFLEQSAEVIFQRYGDEISTLKLVFPSKRARLFFGEALSKLIDKPLWQPQYLAIDDLVWEFSELQQTDNLRLIAELYKVYSKYHHETFDKFYAWGTMLLQDFDTIDKYMVDANTLFRNISDLRDIDAVFASDSPELEIVREFWRTFANSQAQSREQQEFLRIWESLADIYYQFKIRLQGLGVAYAGMAYRRVAQDIEQMYTKRETYCFLGFNALNECEQRIFKFFDSRGDALFLWDYTTLFADDLNQEAGRFIRRNLSNFPQSFLLNNSYNKALDIEVLDSPTDILQCKVLTLKLEDIYAKQGYIDKETVVVLTDENLLEAVLTSIPPCVERLNITMGYPVTNTLVYNLLERLLQLQTRKRDSSFYYKDVVGLLSHPYVAQMQPKVAQKLLAGILDKQIIYVDSVDLLDFSSIFVTCTTLTELQGYLLNVLSETSTTDDARRREFSYALISSISRLSSTIENCIIDLTISIYISLLRQTLRQIRIPYTGEPLGGLQILGILETRNVDFRNVIILSVNDDNFPGNRAGQSYIPYNLRQAYNLPTSTDAEAMYAYYFYRLISRADSLAMLYTSAADDKTTGEQSRYIYQLEYESEFKVRRADISLSIQQPALSDLVVEKSGQIIESLHKKRFSPSSINRYVSCPMLFYFHDIARIKVAESVDEEFTKLNFGNVLHRVMESLYTPLLGLVNPQKRIALLSLIEIDQAIEHALHDLNAIRGGEQLNIGKTILRRFIKQILNYDSHRNDPFVIERLEYSSDVEFCGFTFTGSADRIDRLSDGSIAIIDYKSGQGDSLVFRGVGELFDADKTNKAVLQTLIYSIIFAKNERVDVQPQLYIARMMGDENFSPSLDFNGKRVELLPPKFREDFEIRLEGLMRELADPTTPFVQNPSDLKCAYCDYRSICCL